MVITYSITTNLSIAFVVSIVFYGNGPQFQTSIPSYIELPINAHCQEYIAIGNNNKQYRVCGDRKWAWPPIFRASACSFFFYFSPNLKSWMNVYRSQYKHNYVGLMKLLFSRQLSPPPISVALHKPAKNGDRLHTRLNQSQRQEQQKGLRESPPGPIMTLCVKTIWKCILTEFS